MNDVHDSPDILSLPIPSNYDNVNDFTIENYTSGTVNFDTVDENHVTDIDIVDQNHDTDHTTNEITTGVSEEHLTKNTNDIEEITTTPPRRSMWQRKIPTYLEDLHTTFVDTKIVSTKYPISKFISFQSLSPKFKIFVLSVSSNKEPKTYEEASKHFYWKHAMQEELNALEENHTWTITSLLNQV